MAQRHRVYFLGTLTRNPEVRYAPNGMAVARYGVAVPTRLRHGDTWHTDVCRIEVVAFGPQAATIGTALHKGRGVLIAERMQCLSHPRTDVLEVARGRSTSRRA